MSSHWIDYQTSKPFVPNVDKFGFVYIITNTKTTKAYVGCKQYFSLGKKKMKWETYTGSSKYLKEDIEKIGKEHFTFEVIAEYKNKRSLRYYEAYYQMKWNVLTATMRQMKWNDTTSTIEDSEEPAFYNSYVGGKWYRPIESYQDPEYKKKISQSLLTSKLKPRGEKHHDYRGKAEFYLDDKRMVVNCLGKWCRENGYDRGYVCAIARTNKDGFYNTKFVKGGKRRALSCKGPLGTLTKVRWLVDSG